MSRQHPGARRKGEAALDLWSLVHVASGAGLALLGMGWLWAIGMLAGFEGVEALLRRVKKDGEGLFEYESWPNIVADVVAGLAGFGVAWWLLRDLGWWPWG